MVVLLLPACSRPPHPTPTEGGGPSMKVRVAEVVLRPVWDEEEVVGSVEAAQRAVLSAKVMGVVDSIKVAPGARVASGETLVTIDAREIKARVDQASAAQEQAGRDFERIGKLLRSGAVTPQEAEAAATRLRTADGALAEARTMLQYTEVKAPFDGVVTRKLAEVGDLAVPGKALLEMENASLLRFECEIPEALVDRIRLGSTLPVGVDAAGAELEGRVSEIAPSASAGSRTFLVKLDLPPAEKLRPGQFGRVRVPVRERPAILIPETALVQRGQIETVFVVDEGTARLRLVKSGRIRNGQVEVLGGLAGGERVAASEASLLVDGVKVEVQP